MATDLKAQLGKLSGGQKLVFGGGLLVGLAILAPVAYFALMTVTSIAMAGVVGALLFAGIIAFPMATRWWRTMVLKMMKATARSNPVETLQMEFIARKTAFAAAQGQVVKIVAMRENLKDKLDEYEKKYGKPDDGLEKMASKLSALADRLQTSLKQTDLKLQEFERFVEQQADRWEIAKTTGELAGMLRDAQGGDVTATFLSNTAIDSIRNELNTSFAQIDQILDGEDVKAIMQNKALPMDAVPAMEPIALAAPVRGR